MSLLPTLGFFLTAAAAGFLGSLTGLGGGIIVIPVLTLVFGVDFHYAAGAGLITVIATSSGGAVRYLRQGLADIRIGMFLETATATGALAGAGLAGAVSGESLSAVFGLVVLAAAIPMLRQGERTDEGGLVGDRLGQTIGLRGRFHDAAREGWVEYASQRTHLGFAIMIGAGLVSGLLGIGAGVFKVPAMDTAMRLPIKVSTATSNFMMGVTAASGAAVYFARGDINPFIAAPVALGVLAGARLGSRLLGRLCSRTVRRLFVGVLVVAAVRMMLEGVM
ncbi:MAG: sulfite exporter TauE/SafE family protein [Thermoleophilia bacterium]